MKKASILSVSIFAVILLLLTTAGSAFSTSPGARGYHQMAYDSESGLVILYGGQTGPWRDPESWNHETWSFNPRSEKWKKMSPDTSPGGFGGGDMTYDSKADRSILSIITDDLSTLQTWAYDANSDTWTQLADGPRNMLGQRIAYDSESDRIIMFGGFDMTKYKFVDETWVYDFNTDTWTNMQPKVHPSGRNYVGMAYDSKADRVVLWGDWQRNYTPATDESVWTYDYNTNTWQEFKHKKDGGPRVRDYTMLAYDEKADKIIMYGGFDFGNDETWVYDLNTDTWQQMQPANNPGVISRYAMVYAKDANKVILFGGQDVGDTWSYKLKSDEWTKVTSDQD
jgi:hypothetical protein